MSRILEELVADARELVRRALQLVPAAPSVDWENTLAASWRETSWGSGFAAHSELDDIELDDLLCVDDQKRSLDLNTQQFLAGAPANNVLLWGARGTGKSSLIHALLNHYHARMPRSHNMTR